MFIAFPPIFYIKSNWFGVLLPNGNDQLKVREKLPVEMEDRARGQVWPRDMTVGQPWPVKNIWNKLPN